MLLFVVPGERERMRIAVDGIGDRDHLMQIWRQACEFWQVGLGHGTGRFAMVQVWAVWIVVQRSYTTDGSYVVCRAVGFPCFFRSMAL